MSTQPIISAVSEPQIVATGCSREWFAVATVAKHEKAIAKQFELRSIEHFLPLYAAIRQWKDRKVTLQLPLFSGYIFARIFSSDKGRIEKVPGVLRIVGFNGVLVPISEQEIDRMRKVVESWKAEPCAYLTKGRRVRVCSGPLAGVEGIVLQHKGKLRIVISVDSIMRSFNLELEASNVQLEPVKASTVKKVARS